MADKFDANMFNVDFNEAKREIVSGSGEFTFANKSEKLVAKIMFQPEIDGKAWYVEYRTFFDNQPKPVVQYLVKAVIIDTQAREQTATVLVLKQSQMAQLIGIAQTLFEEENVQLLHPNSQPISFTKEGSGMQTKYKVSALTKSIDCSFFYDYWTKPLVQYADELTNKKEKKVEPAKEPKLSSDDLTELFDD